MIAITKNPVNILLKSILSRDVVNDLIVCLCITLTVKKIPIKPTKNVIQKSAKPTL